MKRFIHIPQIFLGFAFTWGIPMAFSAQTGAVPATAWVLLAANMAWVMAYDTMYAMSDREDDLLIGIKSTAILFGRHDRLVIGLLQMLFLGLMAAAGMSFGLGPSYYGGLVLAGLLCVYHQYLIRERDPDACFRAFLHNNWVGAVTVAGIALDYAL